MNFYFEAQPEVEPESPAPPCFYLQPPAGLHVTPPPTMDALFRASSLLLLGLLCGPPPAAARIPPHDQVARVARFVAHQCDWASVATVSTHSPVQGQPFSNLFSVSDGPQGSGTGVPYLYLTHMELSVQDLQVGLTCLTCLTWTDTCTVLSVWTYKTCMYIFTSLY